MVQDSQFLKNNQKIGNEYETTGTLAGIYEVKTAEGVFICGENIKALINNNEDLHERFDKGSDQNGNYSYFNTAEFRANTLAAIGIALEKAVRAGIIDDVEKADLYVVVTLPHTALDSMHNAVKMITGKQNFTISGDFTRLREIPRIALTPLRKNHLILKSSRMESTSLLSVR